jgi:hypothetical protein
MQHVIDVDETDWPLVVQTFGGQQTDEDVAHFQSRMAEVLIRREDFVSLCYVREYAMNLGHIRRLGEFTREHRGAFEAFCKGAAIVIPSPSFRFILSSFYLMVPMTHPTLICEDVARAEPWLVHRLKEAKMPIVRPLQAPGRLARR